MNEQQMALNNLVQAAYMARLTHEEHEAVQRAIAVLVKLVSPEVPVNNEEKH